MDHASTLVTLGIPAVAAAVVTLFLAGVRRAAPERFTAVAAATAAWLVLGGVLASSGVLARFDARPPPLLLLMAATVSLALLVGCSSLGRALAERIPLWALVAVHAFRLPLELLMHRAAGEGVMPAQMSYGAGGYNFDILTGATAILVAWALRRGAPARLALVWNVLGLVLLTTIAALGAASTPVFHAFGSERANEWIAHFPFVYLPQILVAAALAGHIVVFRAIRMGAPPAMILSR